MAAEAVNDHVDTRFLDLEEFRDRTTLKIIVEDVDEPPVFLSEVYEWKIPENAAVGTVVGSVSARDTDTVNNPIRYRNVNCLNQKEWDLPPKYGNDKVDTQAGGGGTSPDSSLHRVKNHSISNSVTGSVHPFYP